MPKRPKIHFAAGPDPKIGAYVESACGARAEVWTLDAPLTRDVQSVTCGACQRSHLWRAAERRAPARNAFGQPVNAPGGW